MAYDPALSEVILWGGWNGSSIYHDTWAYKAGVWTPLHPAQSPPMEWGSTMVWDPTDGYLVMFAGISWNGTTNQTWAFKDGPGGPNWVLLHPVVSPQARKIPGMVWDGADSEVVLFGGINRTWLNDTWTFVGGNWTQDLRYPTPPWRGGPSMAYDTLDGYVALSNGESTQEYQDLWTFKAGIWVNRTAEAGGSAHIARHRDGAIMVFDPVADYTIVALGESLGAYLNSTVAFANANFTQLDPAVLPPGTQYSAATWDGFDNYLLVFGGANGTRLINQTWAYSSALPLKVTPTYSTSATWAESSVAYSVKISGGVPPYSIAWQFGDGTTAGGGTVAHTYIWPGAFQVNVTVTDNASTVTTQSFVETVTWAPVHPLAFVSCHNTQGYVSLFVPCFGNATEGYPPYSATWSWGDGSALTPGWNATHTFTSVGTFKVLLNVTDRAGRWNSTAVIVSVSYAPPVTPPLSVSARGSPTTGSCPLSVVFTLSVHNGTAPYSYSWLFGDGNSATLSGGSAAGNLTHTYQSAGEFNATVLVNDHAGDQASSKVEVNVGGSCGGPPPPGGGFLGLPGDEGYALVGAIVGTAVVVLLLVMFVVVRRRRAGGVEGSPALPDPAYSSLPPPPSYPSYPPGPGSPPPGG